MTSVKCSVGTCSYNKDGGCYIEKVNIGGKGATEDSRTCCGSFLDQHNYSNLAEYTSCRCIAGEVDCNVNSCRHNNEQKCTLNEIEVNGSNCACNYTETQCASFEKQ